MKIIDHLNLVDLAKKPFQSSPPAVHPKKIIKINWRIILRLLIFCLVVALAVVFIYQEVYAGRIYPGVSLGKFQLGTLTRTEAKDLIEPFIADIEFNGIRFIASGENIKKEVRVKPVLIAVTDPDLSRRIINFDLEATLDQAMAVGRSGSILERLRQIIVSRRHDWPIEAAVQMDAEELKNNLRANFQSLEKPPHDASFELSKKGEIKVIKEEAGYFFDLDKAVTEAENNLLTINNQPVYLTLTYAEPQIKSKDIESMTNRIEETLSFAPITLISGGKQWQIKKNLLGQWLKIQRKRSTTIIR